MILRGAYFVLPLCITCNVWEGRSTKSKERLRAEKRLRENGREEVKPPTAERRCSVFSIWEKETKEKRVGFLFCGGLQTSMRTAMQCLLQFF